MRRTLCCGMPAPLLATCVTCLRKPSIKPPNAKKYSGKPSSLGYREQVNHLLHALTSNGVQIPDRDTIPAAYHYRSNPTAVEFRRHTERLLHLLNQNGIEVSEEHLSPKKPKALLDLPNEILGYVLGFVMHSEPERPTRFSRGRSVRTVVTDETGLSVNVMAMARSARCDARLFKIALQEFVHVNRFAFPTMPLHSYPESADRAADAVRGAESWLRDQQLRIGNLAHSLMKLELDLNFGSCWSSEMYVELVGDDTSYIIGAMQALPTVFPKISSLIMSICCMRLLLGWSHKSWQHIEQDHRAGFGVLWQSLREIVRAAQLLKIKEKFIELPFHDSRGLQDEPSAVVQTEGMSAGDIVFYMMEREQKNSRFRL